MSGEMAEQREGEWPADAGIMKMTFARGAVIETCLLREDAVEIAEHLMRGDTFDRLPESGPFIWFRDEAVVGVEWHRVIPKNPDAS